VKVLITEKTARLGWLFSELAASVWLGGKGFILTMAFHYKSRQQICKHFKLMYNHHTIREVH